MIIIRRYCLVLAVLAACGARSDLDTPHGDSSAPPHHAGEYFGEDLFYVDDDPGGLLGGDGNDFDDITVVDDRPDHVSMTIVLPDNPVMFTGVSTDGSVAGPCTLEATMSGDTGVLTPGAQCISLWGTVPIRYTFVSGTISISPDELDMDYQLSLDYQLPRGGQAVTAHAHVTFTGRRLAR